MSEYIIAIVGASASGKTVFTQTVYDELSEEFNEGSIAVLEEDAYYRDQSHLPVKMREKTNYDHPDAFEHELLCKHLRALRNKQSVDVPIYDFEKHNRASETRRVDPAKVILIEGILLLTDPSLYEQFDIKVFIDAPLDICLLRRIKRDMRDRGRSFDSVSEQYQETVRPMYFEFIQPCIKRADVVVTGGGKNRVAIDMVKQSIRSSLNERAVT